MIKKYLSAGRQAFPAIFLSTAFVLLLLFLNNRNSLNFVENNPIVQITPTAIPTETKWQTYRNEKYSFKFQYPIDWELVIPTKQNSVSVSSAKLHGNLSNNISPFNVEVVNYSLEDFVHRYDSQDYIHPITKSNGEKQVIYTYLYFDKPNPVISRSVALKMNTLNENGLNLTYIYVTYHSKNYLISYLTDNPVYEKIFSTFTFIADTTPIIWKTYRNNKYDFSFNYPSTHKIIETKKGFHGSNDMWGIGVFDTDRKDFDIQGKQVDSFVFELTLSSNFPYDADSHTEKKELKLGNNIFYTYQATKYEMTDVYSFEINDFVIDTYSTNEHLINPIFDQILSTFKFTN